MSVTDIRGSHLHFDCVAGAAGDMTLGALLQLGVPRKVMTDAIVAVGLDSSCLQVEDVVKAGIAAMNVTVGTSTLDASEHHHGDGEPHDHHGHSHHHHHFSDIRKRIESSTLDEGTRDCALAIFGRVARAEAKLHGTTVDEVAFHEVGAVDSIVDIVCSAAALNWLAPSSVSCVAVAMGHGQVKCAHGVLPVPSPAALEILREAGAHMIDGAVGRELCTPTGAAILAEAVTDWHPAPAMTPLAIGYGAGDLDLEDRPNVMRVVAGKRSGGSHELMVLIEANIDDMSGELLAYAADRLFELGAADVWWTPIVMKKGRPAVTLSVLVAEELRGRACEMIFLETSSLGMRVNAVSREVAQRRTETVATEYGPVPVKVALLGERVVNAAPEFDACAALAKQSDVPIKDVYGAAQAAWRNKGG
jgi:uncharacterized protein (TIGR00299 family) protein